MSLKQRERERLSRKYHLEERGTLYVSGMLKQKIKAGGVKIKRYDEKCQQFKQNHLFRTNQKLFYQTLDGKERGETVLPDPTEATSFWRKIWSEEVGHNERASWLETNRPDITLVHKDTQQWTLIDIAVPADQKITRTGEEKVEKYQELAFEIRRIHGDGELLDGCSWKHIKRCKDLVWQARCT